ncbi:MHYT domain-containing protein [Sphingomonas sp. RB3P16]|uniref:MHYT domain-containing protein n=1 Tax=Parasphingomonas frigoris TaxID=3096163 RepID=UPI002FC74F84
MAGVHDIKLVTLSIMIAIVASFTALSLAGHVRAASDRTRRIWLTAAAIALGGGIWSMHFVAMLAFSMPGMRMSYDLAPTLASLALAVAFTGAGLATLDWRTASGQRIFAAGALIGTGVASMHYIGMAAMRMPATLSYNPAWVVISIVIAFIAATTAVWLAARDHQWPHRIAAAILMGAAISGMHYAGMYAAIFTQSAVIDQAEGVADLGQTYLAAAIGLVTLLILLLAIGAVQIERLFRNGAQREARLRILGELNDHLFASGDALRAMAAAAELLGRRLGASRCAYADVDQDGDRFWIRNDYTAQGLESAVGEYSLDLFGARAATDLRGGETLVVRDITAEVAPGDGREMFQAIAIDAIICCPLIKDGRLAAMMAVHEDHARDWTPDEITLVQEVVERCWSHVSRIGAESRLRESEERLRLAVDNAEVGFWDVDVIHDTLIWPPRTKAMFGISPEVPVSMQDFYDGLHPEDRERTAAAFAAAADPSLRALYDVEYRTIGKEDAVVRWVAAKGRGVFDTSGACLRVAGTALNITGRKIAEEALRELNLTLEARIATAIEEREQAQEALRQSQKMEAMGSLTGGVAHDFNNLLTPIIGSLDMLVRKSVGTERERRLIDGALQSAERAKTLVQRLLAFARRQPLQPIAVDVGRLVEGLRELIGSTVGPTIDIRVDLMPDLPTAKADPNQLEMALLNLAVNARDAMPNGGELVIAAKREVVGLQGMPGLQLQHGEYVRLCVSDTGIGMDEATLQRATEPFFSTKGVGQGTGLGLSMVHGLAAQLGGEMTVESKPGEGTTIKLWLPISGAVVDDEHRMPESAFASEVLGMALLVDDEELVRMSTAAMLIDLGYKVVEAGSAEDALRLVHEGLKPDLMITDHLMPGMNGTELARKMKEIKPGLSVLLVSGYADAEGVNPALPRLTKPFRRVELAASLSALTTPISISA